MLIKVNMFVEVEGIDYSKRGEVAEKFEKSIFLQNVTESLVHDYEFDSDVSVDIKAIAIGNR